LNYTKYKVLLLSILFIGLNFNFACAQVTDTTKKDSAENILALPDTVQHLESKTISLLPPAIFVTYGLLSFPVKAIRNVDFSVRNDMLEDHPNFHTTADNYLQFAPIVAVYGLNLAGVRGKNSFIDRSILLLMSEAIFGATTHVLKTTTNRTRPNDKDDLSFPSGHTGNAFTAAEFMAQEYADRSPWYGIAGYSFASATAILRVYNNRHWFSDIVAGAGFGILSTKAAYLIYPLFRNRLFHDGKKASNSLLMPSYRNGSVGFTFVKGF
jgi:hypothetical protein